MEDQIKDLNQNPLDLLKTPAVPEELLTEESMKNKPLEEVSDLMRNAVELRDVITVALAAALLHTHFKIAWKLEPEGSHFIAGFRMNPGRQVAFKIHRSYYDDFKIPIHTSVKWDGHGSEEAIKRLFAIK